MAKKKRKFSAELKVGIVKRMLAGEAVRDLAKEVRVSRTFLYRWKDRYRKLGAAGFRVARGRPPNRSRAVTDPHAEPRDELAAAKQHIAALERKVGRQQLELDFFREALRQVREARRSNDGSGAKSSTPASRR
jgi:transposase-like protein